MAVATTNISTGDKTTSGTTATTASITPGTNHLILLTVDSRTSISAAPNQPTAVGNGLTWVAVNSIVYDTTDAGGTVQRRLTVLRALGTPSTGTIVISFGGQTQTDISWVIDDLTGMDTTGTNGSGAIVQSVTNNDQTASTGTITVTLAAFGSVNNATYGSFASWGDIGQTSTAGTGFAITGSILNGNTNLNTACEFANNNQTAVSLTFSTSSHLGAIGIEIKQAVVVGGSNQVTRMMMGMGM